MLTDNKDNDLARKIYDENVRVHRFEAPIYERIHPEIFNPRAQRELQEDLSLVRKLLPSSNPFASLEGRPLALDIGCGTGNISIKLLKLGFSVTAIDISQEMLDVFQENIKNIPEAGRNLNIICLDIDSFLDREELSSYDCVTIHSVLHHLPHYSDTIRRVSRLLSNGGLIYISHEPLQKKKDIGAHICRFFEKVDSIPLRLWMLFHGITPRDHSFSDYHVQTGIDDKHLANLLSDCGFEIIVCRKYTPWKTKFIDTLAHLMHIRPTCFKLLARKQCD